MKTKNIALYSYFLMLLAYLVSLFLVACSPQRRIERILKRNPHLITRDTLTARDTVRIHDTLEIVIPEIHHDTNLSIQDLDNTAVIHKGKLKIEIKTNATRDSILVNSNVAADTVYYPVFYEVPVEIKVPVDKFIYKKPRDALRWALSILLNLVLTILLIYQFAKAKVERNNKLQ